MATKKSSFSLRRPFWSLSGLLDQIFFLLAGAASFWLAWLVWREGWHSGGWWMVGLFIVVWLITAYLALPRLHRILSSLYVPNYFIGRTRTADGLLGDPVNLALRGSEAQVHQAMTAAGWTLAEEITVRSSWRMMVAIVTRRSYPQAPVSSLFLFGRRQDFTYQQEVDGNPGKRHHVRFWRCPQGWLLPGGHQVDWLAAGTYDRSVGFSLFTLQITHKIDENTDIERDYIVQSALKARASIEVTTLKDFSTGYHSRNGGGDTIQTDGDLPVLEVGRVRARAVTEERDEVILDATSHEVTPEVHNTLIQQLWSRRPPQIAFGVVAVFAALVVSIITTAIELFAIDQFHSQTVAELMVDGQVNDAAVIANWLIGSSIIIGVVWVIIIIVLVGRTFGGSNRLRLALMAMCGLAVIANSFTLTIGKITWSTVSALLFIGLNIVAVLMFSSDAARRFTRARSQARRAARSH